MTVESVSNPHITSKPVSQGSVHLDALRGAAALLVFLNHTRALYFSSVSPGPQPAPTSLAAATTPGIRTSVAQTAEPVSPKGIKLASEAVVIFFVLSGYLVGGSVVRALRQESWSWKDYLVKRLTRLWVPLIPCLLLTVMLDQTGFRIFGDGSIYRNPPGIAIVTSVDLVHRMGLVSLLGNLFFLQDIYIWYLGTNVSLWSLANEFWYYLIFPCLALAIAKGRALVVRILYVIAAVAMLIFIKGPVSILFPIWLFGAVVAMLPKRLDQRQARTLSVIGLVGLLATMAASARLLPLTWVQCEYLIGIVTSVFLYIVVQQREAAGRGLYRRIAGYFSQISYTLYIVHLPIAIFLAAILNSPWRSWSRTPAHLAIFLAAEVIVLAAATLLWRLFEANTDVIRKRLFERRSRIGINPAALP